MNRPKDAAPAAPVPVAQELAQAIEEVIPDILGKFPEHYGVLKTVARQLRLATPPAPAAAALPEAIGEVTTEMKLAGQEYARVTADRPKGLWWWGRLYEAMRNAAPSHPSAQQAASPSAELTKLDLTLTQKEVCTLTNFCDASGEDDDEALRLLIGPGHSGYGLYAASPDYPEEGAVFVKQLASPTATAPAGANNCAGCVSEAVISGPCRSCKGSSNRVEWHAEPQPGWAL